MTEQEFNKQLERKEREIEKYHDMWLTAHIFITKI